MLKNYSKIEVDDFGTKEYLIDEGKYHRLDGSAIEWSDGSKFWVINGKAHRNIDPCLEYSDGEKRWYFKGKGHRIGGSYNSHRERWYIDNKEYSKKNYFNKVWSL